MTALHPERRDRVRVELDGAPWRSFPTAAVVSAGLSPGLELDRSRARELGRALRRTTALDTATAAISRRERSAASLAAYLERRGIRPADRNRAVETLQRLRYVDDDRVAASRAASLARRGFGDEGIRFDLADNGLDEETVERALAALDPEPARAKQIAASAGRSPKTARRLAAKGFSTESIESALGLFDG